MTPSPSQSQLRHPNSRQWRRWRYPVVAVAVSAALVISPMAVQASADDQSPKDPSLSVATEDGAPGATTEADPTEEPTDGAEADEPSGRPAQGPSGAADLAPLQCDTVYAIQGTGTRNVYAVNTTTGVLTSAATFDIALATGSLNALGISADGQKIYGVLPANLGGSGRSIYVHDMADGTTTLAEPGVASAVNTHGAVNPATGIYYYGGLTGTTLNIYGYDPATDTSLGKVANGTITGAAGGNGDMAFDTAGRLYFVAGTADDNPIFVLDQSLPTAAVGTPLTVSATKLATSDADEAINGLAFGGDGFLYISSGSTVYKINPSSGSTASQAAFSGGTGSVDLASCAVPSTLEVRKNFPDGRAVATDQATLSISGGGIPTPVTATTTGTDSGIQGDPTETAGPVLGLNGTTYTISESGAGTGAAYVSSWRCVNSTTGATLSSGTGTSGTVTLPAGTATVPALCTFTNAMPRDYGDAPASYGTTIAGNGPAHLLGGPRLGAAVDGEADGAPGAGADGDDGASTDDEDGVTFNPALAYPNPTIRTGTDPVTLGAPVNHVTVNASAAGFASVWVDWNEDGDFADAGERVADAQPVGAGDNDVTFSQAANPPGIRTFVRVRYSTDASSIHAPTGAAPDGEVEDYQVLVERLVVPSACAPVSDPFYALTYTSVTEKTTGPDTARYPAVTVVGGVAVDMLAAVAAPGALTPAGFVATQDDATWNLVNGSVAMNLTFTFVRSGTTTPIAVNGVWSVNDMDLGESTVYSKSQLAGWTITPGSKVILTETGTTVKFAGGVSGSGDPTQRYQVWFTGRSQLTTTWVGSGFGLDGDGDVSVPPSCDDYGDAPDSYKTLLTSDGPHHTVDQNLRLGGQVEFDGDGQPTPAANGDDSNRLDDEDGVGPLSVTTGSPVGGIPVTVTNTTGAPATLAGWVDLDKSGSFDTSERVVATVAPATVDGTVTLTFPGVVTATQSTYARFRVFPGVVADPLPSGAATAGEVEDYSVTTTTPALEVVKTSDATASSKPGDVVHYSVALTNTGTGAFTAANPARLFDDLTDVLDDATYDNDAAATIGGAPSYAAPRITWAGALDPGQTVTVTYSVTLGAGGDGHVRNVAFGPPGTDPNPPTPDCTTPGPVPCDTELFELPKLAITKTANRTQLTATGQTVTYTVVVTNTGPGDYTAAHLAAFSDDLSDVVDDAEVDAASVTVTSGNATFLSPLLVWTGELPAGASATITYTATYLATGDHVLDNTACVPVIEARTPAERCDSAHVAGSSLTHAKSVSPVSGTAVEVGDVLTYTLAFTNTGTVPADVATTDDLSDVLDDADLVAGSVTAGAGLSAVPSGTDILVTGTVPAGETRTVTYQVTVKPFAQQGDHVLENALACEPGDPAPCDPETTTNPVAHLVVDKSSNRTADSKPGDTVTYTVTAQNDGPGDFTVADPASVVDDLTGVLDDATYGNDAVSDRGAAPTYAAPRITWVGALVHGDTVTITYTVELEGGGDGIVRNVVWQPVDPGTPGPTPDCATSPRPCDTESFDLPKLSVAKSADRSDLPATGQDVTYTVVVSNPGPGDYTVAHPATFSDDLSEVLDDATLTGAVTATVGAASITGTTLSWSGVLAAGDSATISYTFTYRATGNHVLDNTACVPAAEAQAPAESCDSVSVPGSGLVHHKSVSPASGSAVEVGDVLTYTLSFDNTEGTVAATVDTEDDLSAVLDDATLDAGSVTAGAGLTATPTPAGSPTALAITGSVPAGATRTVTYEVTVKPFAQQGDHVITNALACEPGEPVPCAPETTTNPVRHVVLTKVKTSPAAPDTGDTVTYTLTVHNDGTGDWTAADPAAVVDDLTDVLDDATWDDTATASAGSVAFTSPQLTWSGALAHGDTVTVTYGVTVTNLGDHRMANTASVPGCQLPECTPPTVVTPLPHVVPAKTSTPAPGQPVQPGEVVTYTLSWTNDGHAPGVVDSTDDLSGVLDDAVVVTEPTSSDPAVTATRSGASLRVAGPIAVGATVTVTYQVKVKPSGQHGDNDLANVLTADTPQVTCPPFPCTPVAPPVTSHPVGDLDDWKTVDPAAGTPVKAGRRLTYTLHFASVGTGPVTVAREDDLSGVLDDATMVGPPTSSSPALTVAGPNAGRIAVTGTLSAGATATVTYTVEVKHDGLRGDDRLGNFLVDPGQQPPTSCSAGSPRADVHPDCTLNQVVPLAFDLRLDKEVVSSTTVEPGDTVRYRLRVSNRGPDTAPSPIVLRDALPAGLELVSARGRGWTCAAKKASDVVVCRRVDDLAAGRKAPAVHVVAKVAEGASGRIVNKAKVKAAGDVSPANNRDTAPLTVSSVPGLPHTGFRVRVPLLRFGW